MNETIVIYHGGCRDGFCAAWVVDKYRRETFTMDENLGDKNWKFHPGFYGQEPPDVTGKDVIIVDFCYDSTRMIGIFNQAKSLVWLDHHKTAQSIANMFEDNPEFAGLKYDFDITRSGAGIAWDYFFPNEPRPWLVDYVEDRDLWTKKLPDSDYVNAYISCLEFNFDIWNIINSSMTLSQAIINGVAVEAKTQQYIREVCKNVYFADISNSRDSEIPGIKYFNEYNHIPIVNICQVDCSEVMHELCKLYPNSPFSLYWFKRQDGMYQYGLRSIGDFDVSEVAKLFGGGGHKNAAGFQLNYLLEELK